MIVFDTLFIILIIYIFIYCVYQLFFSIGAKKLDIYFNELEKSRCEAKDEKNLCVVIFANYKNKNLDNLLSALNTQTYTKEKYQVHVVYQKDENDTSISRDFAYGAQIHNIQNPDYFSTDKAMNLFLDKMLDDETIDAYVFVGADRIVGEKYLENINKSLLPSCVLVGSRVATNEKNQFAKRVKNSIISAYLKYANRTNILVRAMFKLPFFIDSENFVITHDILKKIGYVGVEDKDSELEFSLCLAANDVKSIYCPYIITGVDVKNYDFSNPTLKAKFDLFTHYFPILAFKDIAFKEFILFLLKPNSIVVLLSFLFLLCMAVYLPHHVARTAVALLGVFLFVNLVVSINIAQIQFREIFWLCLYPFCLAWQKVKIFINNLTMRSIADSNYEEENINSATINAVVNNGKKDIYCKLDLVSEDGMRKVVFREGNHFIGTDSYLRMYDALEEITYKLQSKGMTLKTCQNCQHFTICPDGTLDCLNGKCNISQNEILVWNGCQYFYLRHDKKEN
ncbi:MAG: hypothetical protein IJD57_03515 [Candidatus Gastranaerophilales bacterium]|nr:hypothetical protein [Candidatus Gastranaerophilales bacterium]